MRGFTLTGLLTMIISLTISLVSGFCTVVGMGKVFTSAALVTMFIAVVIEVGRVILLYDLHHYWEKLKWKQRIPGLMMLLIAMTLSAMGVYGFFADAHSHKTQDIIPIEMEIKEKEAEINIIEEAIKVNDEQLKQFDGKAFAKYTEMGYVTKAVNLQKEQQQVTNKLYDDNRLKRQEIAAIQKQILELKLSAEQKSPTLAHLKYYAKLFNVDDDTAIIIFIVMIMTVFDTLAMYLMITADWINKLDIKDEEKYKVKLFPAPVENKLDLSFIEKELKDIKKDLLDKKVTVKDVKEYDDTKLFEKLDKLQSMMNNNDLVSRLDEIESKITSKNYENNIDNEGVNSVLLNKVIDSIDENEEVILRQDFAKLMKQNPDILRELKKVYLDNPSIFSKLKQL